MVFLHLDKVLGQEYCALGTDADENLLITLEMKLDLFVSVFDAEFVYDQVVVLIELGSILLVQVRKLHFEGIFSRENLQTFSALPIRRGLL